MKENKTTPEPREIETNVKVARLTEEDIDVLPEYVALIREGLLDIPQSPEALAQDLERNTVETYTERLHNKDYFLYTARDPQSDELIGVSYGVIRSKEGVSEKYKLAGHFGLTIVRADRRGSRIGGELKDAFEQDCARRDVPVMTTFVYDANLSSIAMNKRRGMQEVLDDPVLVPQDGGRYYAKPTPTLRPS